MKKINLSFLLVFCSILLGNLGAKAFDFVPDGNTTYYIQNKGTSLVLTRPADYSAGAYVVTADNAKGEYQQFKFVAMEEVDGQKRYKIQSVSGSDFVASTGSWNSEFNTAGTEYWLDYIADGYVAIRNVGKTDGLGVDGGNDKNVYSNKGGNGNNNQWLIYPIDKEPGAYLIEFKIKEANELAKNDNVPATIKTLLETAIQAASEVVSEEDPAYIELKNWVSVAISYESAISGAKTLDLAEGFSDAVKTALNDSIDAALNVTEEQVKDTEASNQILTTLKGATKNTDNLNKAIVEAKNTLIKESSWGFGDAEKAALEAAITKATTGLTVYDPEVMANEIIALNEAIATYLASEKLPQLNPTPGQWYRVVMADPTMGYWVAGSDRQIQFKTELSEDQLFRFEEVEDGQKGEYRIVPKKYEYETNKSGGNTTSYLFARYTTGDGGRNTVAIDTIGGKGTGSGNKPTEVTTVFIPTYEKTVNGVQYFTIKTQEAGRFMRFEGTTSGKVLRTYATLSNVNWELFAIVPDGEVNKLGLKGILTEASSLYDETEEGTGAGQYQKADRDAFKAAIDAAQAIYDSAEATQEQVDVSVVDLTAAMDGYKLAKLADRTALQELVAAAEARLSETVEGSDPGEFLPETRAELQGSINIAKNILETEVLTQVEADAAVVELQAAIDTYNNSQILSFNTSKVYYLQGKGGNYLGRENDSEGTRVSVRGSDSSASDVYPITLTRVDGKANVYNIRRYPSGEYLANPSSYAVYFQSGDLADTEATNVQLFELENGYLLIKFLRNKYFGANNTGANQNTASDKNDGDASQWKLVENKKLSLAYMISLAEALVAEDYTSLTWASFEPALAAAKALTAEATDEEIEAAMTALQSAMDALVNISVLKNLIASTEELVETDYTGSTWSVLQDELIDAKSILDSATDQAEVNGAVSRLQAAIDGLINIADLQSLVDSSKALKVEDYAPASWDALQAGIVDAETVLQSATSQDEVDSAIATLQTIVNNLVSLVNLKESIADVEASNLKEDDYSVASWKVLSDALTAAEGILVNATTQSEVNNAASALTAAANGLISVVELKEAIASGKDFVESDYTTVSWTAYTTALGTANAAIETALSTSTVANAQGALLNAISGLVNVKDLRALVATAKEKKEADYTAESWSAFKSALNAAESALETAANQAAVDVAKVALQKAMDDLALKTGIDELQSAGVDMYVSGQTLYVTGLSDQVVISGYDVSGRMIFTEQVSEATFTRELPVGNYVITIKGYVNGSKVIISK